MKKHLLIVVILGTSLCALAQSFGEIAPDFTVVDIEGNEISLYADILDQGKIAIVDVSATWCGPCWALHESHVLQDLHEAYGPDGTDQVRVIYYEADAGGSVADTSLEDLQGTGDYTLGDWLSGSTYPFVNESPVTLDLNLWAPLGFPTLNIIDPSDYTFVADPYNIFTIEGQVEAINNSVEGSPLDISVVGTEELDANLGIRIFPNPSSEFTTLVLEGFSGASTVQIFDLLGKEISSFVTLDNSERIDVSELNTGNYVVRVSNSAAEVTRRLSVVK